MRLLQLQELMLERGWHFNTLIKPAALHFVFTQQHKAAVPPMLEDLQAALADLRALSAAERAKASGKSKIYGLAASVSERGLLTGILSDYQDAVLDVE